MANALSLLVLLTGCCGPHRWTKTDVALESAFALETVADGFQSTTFVDNCHEENPVIGPCGNRVPLPVYIPVSALLHAGITWAIPEGKWRTLWLGITVGAEADTLYANHILKYGH